MIKPEDVKVRVEFTEGYVQRYTAACLEQLKKREQVKRSLEGPKKVS